LAARLKLSRKSCGARLAGHLATARSRGLLRRPAPGRSLVVDVEQTAEMRRALPPPGHDAGAGRANTWEIYYRPRHPGFGRDLPLGQQPRAGERSRLGGDRRVLREIEQRRDVELVGAINVAFDDLESRRTLPGMQRNSSKKKTVSIVFRGSSLLQRTRCRATSSRLRARAKDPVNLKTTTCDERVLKAPS
jgi:hypothetical protein